MWCGKCQADVAAEVSSNNQRVFCTVCGNLLSMIDAPPVRPASSQLTSDKTKDARELLQRWSSGQVLDPFGPSTKLADRISTASTTLGETAEKPLAIAEIKAPEVATVATPQLVAIPSPTITAVPISTALPATQTPLPIPAAPIATVTELVLAITPPPLPNPLSVVDSGISNSVTAVTSPLNTSTSLRLDPPSLAVPNPLAMPVSDDRRTLAFPTSPFAASDTVPASSSVHRRTDAAHPNNHFVGGNTSVRHPETHKTPEARWPMAWLPKWDPAVWRTELASSNSWSTTAGQMLAYLGVLGLTAGACLVVWCNFGGPVNYAATGWLIATAGQMLLFFGVVTLVSGGLEQTTDHVNKRIEQLGDHIMRIEQAAREISQRGSSVPPAHFGRALDSAHRSHDERAVVEE